MFTSRVITKDADQFGLGYLFTVEFSNESGSVKHQYTKDGRIVVLDGSKKTLVSSDTRFTCFSDEELYKQIQNHLVQFNAVEAGSQVPLDETLDPPAALATIREAHAQPDERPRELKDLNAHQVLEAATANLQALVTAGDLPADDSTYLEAKAAVTERDAAARAGRIKAAQLAYQNAKDQVAKLEA